MHASTLVREVLCGLTAGNAPTLPNQHDRLRMCLQIIRCVNHTSLKLTELCGIVSQIGRFREVDLIIDHIMSLMLILLLLFPPFPFPVPALLPFAPPAAGLGDMLAAGGGCGARLWSCGGMGYCG